jgi:hypothetical protein
MFVSTHSKECLIALADAAGDNADDIVLWRTERNDSDYSVKRFAGKYFVAGIEYGEEIR